MSLSKELSARGFIYQYSTESIEEIFDGPSRVVYLGIDPTADSMHVGHLVPYMMLNHIMRHGHSVIALLGGGTALIGDPSFKNKEREVAAVDTIKTQCVGLEKNIRAITTSDQIQFVNNYDWLTELNAIEFLRDVGKYFTVNSMIKKDSVSRRFQEESGISYTEFSYSLLQAYDFYHLHTTYGCDVQIGGSDQWGNIIAGVDYVRRRTGQSAYAVTMPLITDRATGKKFGKSEGNAVWLDADKTTPYQFYQFWLQTSDESVVDYLKLFTFLPLTEIADIEAAHRQDPARRIAQITLAKTVTSFVHGDTVAESVARVSAVLFGSEDMSLLDGEDMSVVVANAPYYTVSPDITIVDLLVSIDLASSKREARTFVTQGAVMVDGVVVDSTDSPIGIVSAGRYSLVKRGKKRVAVVDMGDRSHLV